MEPNEQDDGQFVLPLQVFGVAEVQRLSRELEALDDYMRQASIRSGGDRQEGLPRVSRLLDATANENRLNLLQKDDRQKLATFLGHILKQAPTIHMSFASDPSAAFLEKLVGWLRNNIHPLVLIRLGLQPSIAAGCVLRTANHSFDFSLRHRFAEEHQLLIYSLETGQGQRTPATTPQAQSAESSAKRVEVVSS